MCPLLGIAASPVQGKSTAVRGVRWRLMLTYYDHSVLSYELWREEESAALLVF